ncbi:MAG: methylated-DNA--[protein]-cysteine S-methyltransferase [Alphaproteobacteria bacterium]
MDSYSCIARAIEHMARRFPQAVTLAELAAKADLSPAHFQKTFSRFVGVSPKKLAQHMALDHALMAFADGATVLDAAFAAGLSGPSRLHDLFVEQQAMTPGEARRRGAGLDIAYGYAPSPFGEVLIGETARGIVAIAFVGPPFVGPPGSEPPGSGPSGRSDALQGLRARWPAARWHEVPGMALATARRVFAPLDSAPGAKRPPLRLHLLGTRHQLRVWRALLAIPAGSVTSYSALAKRCGIAGSARAVANAVADNPIAVLIPCHRVLRSSGALAGYAWGLSRKRALLAWEQASTEQPVSPPRQVG